MDFFLSLIFPAHLGNCYISIQLRNRNNFFADRMYNNFVWFQEDITLSLLDKCKQSLSVIKEIVESTTNDEETLFEALYLNDELQQLVSKYEELEASQSSGAQLTQNADTAKHDAEAVQNPNERCEGDESEESEAAQSLDRKLPKKSNTLEVDDNATKGDGHAETKIVDSTEEKNGESSLKSNTTE